MDLQPHNTGLVIVTPKPTAWRADGASGVVKVVLKADGTYDASLPDEERQMFGYFDSRACVTFSATDCLETIFNLKLSLGLFSPAQVTFAKNEGYIDPFTGKFNFSDRFTAKMSHTTPEGNNFEAVGDSIRNDGLLPEKEWPFPVNELLNDPTAEGYTKNFAIYYKEIPQALKDKAKRFLDHFKINYEWTYIQGNGGNVAVAIQNALPYGPVQIGIEICTPWSSTEGMPPINACGCTPQHGVEVYGLNDVGARKIFDSYKSFRKLLAADYCIPYAFQYFVSDPIAGLFTRDLSVGSVGEDVKLLQVYLNAHSAPVASTGPGSPGHETTTFGNLTKNALRTFQVQHGISPAVGYFGPITRQYVNAHP